MQWIALYIMLEEEPINQRNLAGELGVADSSAGRLIDRLEKMELVERAKDPQDRRSFVLTLTNAGRKRIDELLFVGESFNEELVEGICEEELQIYEKVLNKMVINVIRQ